MSNLRRNIAEMAGYVPGFQPPDEKAWIKLNTNENPYPPSPSVVEAILAEVGEKGEMLRKYPDAASRKARETAAQLYGFDPEWIDHGQRLGRGAEQPDPRLRRRRGGDRLRPPLLFLLLQHWPRSRGRGCAPSA